MTTYATLDGAGCILGLRSTNLDVPVQDGAVEAPGFVTPEHYLSGAEWLLRPRLSDPVLAGLRLTWAGAPPGTVFRIEDNEVADAVGETEEVEIDFPPGAASYVVRAQPPAPWLSRDWTVEIA